MPEPRETERDPFNLQRFVLAQESTIDDALRELRAGCKRTHWMWFIFPQLAGLGSSATATRFAIASRQEAVAYLEHPTLGSRLRACTQAALACGQTDAGAVFGFPDDLKFRSSMTLFSEVAVCGSVFAEALKTFFAGARDERTLELLASLPEGAR